jgi:hypothetical protein
VDSLWSILSSPHAGRHPESFCSDWLTMPDEPKIDAAEINTEVIVLIIEIAFH